MYEVQAAPEVASPKIMTLSRFDVPVAAPSILNLVLKALELGATGLPDVLV